MLVKVIRPFLHTGGVVLPEGKVVNLTDSRAKELEKKGLVVPTLGGRANPDDAFQQRPTGGETGAEKVAPSLPQDQVPLVSKSISRRRGKKQKSSQ